MVMVPVRARGLWHDITVNVDAKFAGIIPSVKPILAKIKATNFRITEQLELLILKKAGEY